MLRSQIRRFPIQVLHGVVYGNLLVSFGAYSLCIFFISLHASVNVYLQTLPKFIFFATLFTYNFHRRIGLELYGKTEHSTSVEWMIAHPILSRSITLISFAASVYFFMDLPKSTYLLIAPLSLISLMYVIKFSDKMPLRQIPFLKVFLIAIAWSSTVILLSSLSYEIEISQSTFLLFLAFTLFMIAEVLPFDIRDMRSDRQTDLKTIPNYLGIRSAILIASVCLMLSNALFILAIDLELAGSHFIAWVLSSIYLSTCLILCSKPRSDLFYSFLIESSLFLPFLFLLIIG